MRHCPNDLPFLTLNGNRDIGNHIFTEHAWKGYEKQFMEMYYYFQIGNRYFITIDTQVYKLGLRNDKEAEKFRMRQNYWLHELFRSLPKSAPKTVFMHTPLFIETPDEVLAGIEEESLDIEIRLELLNLFDTNGVDSVFSGHVHYENLALWPYDGFHHSIKQFILTSINYQTIWYSEESGKTWGPSIPSYYKIHVLNDKIKSIIPIRIQNI